MATFNCKNCGRLVSDRMNKCPNCGTSISTSNKYPQFYGNSENKPAAYQSRENQKFCKHCGQLIDKECVVCPKCGKQVEELKGDDRSIIINNTSNSSSNAVAYAVNNGNNGISPKSRLVTLLLCLFLGVFGAHRLYTGKILSGLIMIPLMLVYIGEIWLLVDFIFIIVGAFKDKNGLRVANW